MSFILDALRKSEDDRQRDSAPALARVPQALPEPRVPTWAWTLIACLGLSVLLLAGAWWRGTMTGDPAALGERTTASSDAALEAAPILPGRAAAGDESAVFTDRNETGTGVQAGSGRAGAAPTDREAVAAIAGSALSSPSTVDESIVPESADVAGPAVVDNTLAAARAQSQAPEPTLPTIDDAAAQGLTIPELTLELHVYHTDPASRFVYINGARYGQGQRIPNGPRIIEIRPEGAVLDLQGRQFLLLPQ